MISTFTYRIQDTAGLFQSAPSPGFAAYGGAEDASLEAAANLVCASLIGQALRGELALPPGIAPSLAEVRGRVDAALVGVTDPLLDGYVPATRDRNEPSLHTRLSMVMNQVEATYERDAGGGAVHDGWEWRMREEGTFRTTAFHVAHTMEAFNTGSLVFVYTPDGAASVEAVAVHGLAFEVDDGGTGFDFGGWIADLGYEQGGLPSAVTASLVGVQLSYHGVAPNAVTGVGTAAGRINLLRNAYAGFSIIDPRLPEGQVSRTSRNPTSALR